MEGKLWFLSHEEAEYTAELAFCLAVGLSWWALRTGRATFKVPRAPTPVAVGSRVGWTSIEPAALRSWQMAAVGTRLGLRPPDGEYPDCPNLVRADMWQPDGQFKALGLT